MKAGDIFKKEMKSRKITQEEMKDRVNAKSQSVVAMALGNSTFNLAKLLQYAEALGLEVVIKEKKRGRRPEGEYLVTLEDESNEDQES